MVNSDGVVFGTYLVVEKQNNVTVANFIQANRKSKQIPSDLGFKFNILLFNRLNPEEKEIDLFSAILGDMVGYVERIGKLGYSGIILKRNTFTKKMRIGKVLSSILDKYQFSGKLKSKVLKELLI